MNAIITLFQQLRAKQRIRWLIRTKILILLSSLIFLVILAELILAHQIMDEEDERLFFEINRSHAEQIINQWDGSLRRVIGQMKLIAQYSSGNSGLAQSLFDRDAPLIAFQFVHILPHSQVILSQFLRGKQELSFTPFDAASLPQGIIVENQSDSKSGLYRIRIPVTLPGKPLEYFAQAWVDAGSWIASLKDTPSMALYIVWTASGEVFAHSPGFSSDFNNEEIFQKASSRYFIYRKAALGNLTVISMIPKKAATFVSRSLVQKTIFLAMILLTLAFLVSIYFSRTLSAPLLSLVQATREIAQGHFDARIDVKNQDEIGILATSFAQMVRELKEYQLKKNIANQAQQEKFLKSSRLVAIGEIAGQAAHEVLNPLTVMISNLETILLQMNQFTDFPSAPLPLLRVIASSWDSLLKSGGIDLWIQDLSKPSQVRSNQRMAEEDTDNIFTILKETDTFLLKIKNSLKILLRESYRISRIVEQMRGLSRNASIPTLLSIQELIEDSVQFTENYLLHLNIKIKTVFFPAQLFIRADSDEIRQVLSNLIKNSIDAIKDLRNAENLDSKNTEGLILIQSHATDDTVKITIWDNGIGISKENQIKILDESFTTKGKDGTGFGLSICRRFIEGWGGTLTLLKTEVGKFTVFEMVFPRVFETKKGSEV